MAAKKPSTKSKQRVKKPTKSEMLEEAADLLSRIEEAERRCTVAKLRIEDRKEAYRNARNAYADCVDELRKLARARAENHPLFDQAEKQQQAQETQSVESKSVDKNGWRSLPLAELKLPAKTEKAIIDAGLKTLGALTDFVDEHGETWPDQVKGFGEKGRETVCGAYISFWESHPEYCGDSKAAA